MNDLAYTKFLNILKVRLEMRLVPKTARSSTNNCVVTLMANPKSQYFKAAREFVLCEESGLYNVFHHIWCATHDPDDYDNETCTCASATERDVAEYIRQTWPSDWRMLINAIRDEYRETQRRMELEE